MDRPRIDDTLISANGEFYEVVESDFNVVKAKHQETGKLKKFKFDKLFCVDFDDGIWQETIN